MFLVFWAFLGAALVHMGEEFFFPGGFMLAMKRFAPHFSPYITVPFAIAVNAAFVVLLIAGALVGEKNLDFSLSMGALLFFNGCIHLVATIARRHYVPGLISSLLLYLPFAIAAYVLYFSAGQISFPDILLSILLGLLYQAIPLALLLAASWTKTRPV